MKRREDHIGRRQRRHLAHEAARRRKRRQLAHIECLRKQFWADPARWEKSAWRDTA